MEYFIHGEGMSSDAYLESRTVNIKEKCTKDNVRSVKAKVEDYIRTNGEIVLYFSVFLDDSEIKEWIKIFDENLVVDDIRYILFNVRERAFVVVKSKVQDVLTQRLKDAYRLIEKGEVEKGQKLLRRLIDNLGKDSAKFSDCY